MIEKTLPQAITKNVWTIDGIVLKGNQAVLSVSLRTNAIGLAHEGHYCADKTLHLLRQTCWFPGMRKQAQDFVASCLPCNAVQPSHIPTMFLCNNFPPDRPWQKVHADFKEPTGGNTTYILLLTSILNFLRLTWYQWS